MSLEFYVCAHSFENAFVYVFSIAKKKVTKCIVPGLWSSCVDTYNIYLLALKFCKKEKKAYKKKRKKKIRRCKSLETQKTNSKW